MHAAGSRAGPIMPAECIVTGYCLDISESASFTAVWSKQLIVYDSKVAYVQILTGNIERSLSEKDVNFTCFVKKLPVFNESVTRGIASTCTHRLVHKGATRIFVDSCLALWLYGD